MTEALRGWGKNPPTPIIDKGVGDGYDARVPAFEQRVLSASWTDFSRVQSAPASLWQTQAQSLEALLNPETLAGATYQFLLLLLIALASGDQDAQQCAGRVLSLPTSMSGYPNDVFVNTLVYVYLLEAADPLGTFAWDNARLLQHAKDLAGLVVGGGPTPTSIRQALRNHGQILSTDAAYPMQDPYDSDTFDDRRTNALFALDRARAAARAGSAGGSG